MNERDSEPHNEVGEQSDRGESADDTRATLAAAADEQSTEAMDNTEPNTSGHDTTSIATGDATGDKTGDATGDNKGDKTGGKSSAGEADSDEKQARADKTPDVGSRRRRSRVSLRDKRVRVAAVVVLVLAIVVGVGGWAFQSRSDALAERDNAVAKLRSSTEDLNAARKAAEAYTNKAITIDYNRSEDYVKDLAVGATATFGDTFSTKPDGAGQLIIELQQQLRMHASGKVVHTLFTGDIANPPPPGQPWDMIVVANQTTSTAQQPERSTQVMVLKVTVVRLDGEWKIANFGPDPQSMGSAVAIPGAN
ncbi:hypothetical protein GOEFS_022_00190 [Gordonia effusa NBRC 100432]|uniref:Uncharacterized protein n=1 Tax=Gordonia effusa NBRC 100432 TaxID=1077974 RepID=H0QWN8_9ACTN|nr:hypothetical protein [Gordonia effusa]GAB17239.1 hypothetical protein GOEFS_022_00190 [Gordonia effusa NBRC 100432]